MAPVIELDWQQSGDMLLEAVHDGWRFTIAKKQNWDRHPQQNYDYVTSAYQHGQLQGQLGTFTDSTAARAKCVEFINSKAGDSPCPKQ